MSEGGKPGITTRVQVVRVDSGVAAFSFADFHDAEYFQGKEGQEFMAKFVPVEPKKDDE